MHIRIVPAAALLFAAPLLATAPPAVPNGGFEEASGPVAASWSVDSPLGAEASVVRDPETAHDGGSSLRLSAPRPASISVSSAEVRLEVGRVYRLSAFVRTEKAASDPTGRYPTPVAAALTMVSFPFTNHSPASGATRPFGKVETLFVATTAKDRVRLHLGLNGTATGTAWFDDVTLEEVTDVRELVPMETVRWHGPAFRYDEKGWIYVHVEGEPYVRGFQYGTLLSEEIAGYAKKLGIQENPKDGPGAWAEMRFMADAVFLRKFDEEYLLEMKGIADGAAKAGAKVDGRAVDFLDVVTMNSSIDLDYVRSALRTTPHALTGRSFLSSEDEAKIPERAHKCSSFVATGPATKDGRPVFGQIFMWAGYTGVHFNVIVDVVPSKGNRLVYQTYPGGIHSGTDFYMNSAGILIGETTVAQTPWNLDGTPMSNRIRKAAQYASSIDDVARILREKNNGMYTNDWPIADVKTNEVAILLLGTNTSKLWRTKEDLAPFGTPGFLWANNNPRDPEVRKEYGVQPDDAPYDLAFGPWDRDVAFRKWYDEVKGKIDAIETVNLWASSPINRPHACDGKVTTAEMAEKLVFLAHYGKVTLREKFPVAGNRRMPDHPGAIPHLTLGYAVFSPVYIAEKLKEAKAQEPKAKGPEESKDPKDPKETLAAARGPKEPTLDVAGRREPLRARQGEALEGERLPEDRRRERPRLGLGRVLADPQRPPRRRGEGACRAPRPARRPERPGRLVRREGRGRRHPGREARVRPPLALPDPAHQGDLRAPPAPAPPRERDVPRRRWTPRSPRTANRDVTAGAARRRPLRGGRPRRGATAGPVDRGEGLPGPEGRGEGHERRRRLDRVARRNPGGNAVPLPRERGDRRRREAPREAVRGEGGADGAGLLRSRRSQRGSSSTPAGTSRCPSRTRTPSSTSPTTSRGRRSSTGRRGRSRRTTRSPSAFRRRSPIPTARSCPRS